MSVTASARSPSREYDRSESPNGTPGSQSPVKIFQPINPSAEVAQSDSPIDHSPMRSVFRSSSTPLISLHQTDLKLGHSVQRVIAQIVFCNKEYGHTNIVPRGCQGFKTDDGVRIIFNGQKGKIPFGYNGSFKVIQDTKTSEIFFRRDVAERSSPGCCSRNWHTFMGTSPYVY